MPSPAHSTSAAAGREFHRSSSGTRALQEAESPAGVYTLAFPRSGWTLPRVPNGGVGREDREQDNDTLFPRKAAVPPGSRGPAKPHLLLDVLDALGVLPRGAVEAPHGPCAQLVVDVEEDGERHEEEADEDPAVVHQHGLQPAVPHPEQQEQQPRAHRPQSRHDAHRPLPLHHGRAPLWDPAMPRPPLARSPPAPRPSAPIGRGVRRGEEDGQSESSAEIGPGAEGTDWLRAAGPALPLITAATASPPPAAGVAPPGD